MSLAKTSTNILLTGGVALNIVGALPGLPGQQVAPGLVAGNAQIAVVFDTAFALNGGTLVQYDLRYSTNALMTGAITVAALTSPYTLPGLTNGQIYYIQTRAVTNVGASALWSNTSFTTPTAGVTVPNAMTKPVVAPISGGLVVDLVEGTFNGGSAILSEDLRYGTDGTTWTTLIGVTDPRTITGLTNGIAYQVQSRSVNAIGPGAWSPSEFGTPQAVGSGPPAPTVTVSSLSQLQLLLASWNAGGWNTTAASLGISASAPRYIGLANGFYGALSISSLSFGARVYIQSVNWSALSANFSQIAISNTANVTVQFVSADRAGLGRLNNYIVSASGSIGAEILYNFVQDDPIGHSNATTYGIYAYGASNNARIIDNLVMNVTGKGIYVRDCTGVTVQGNMTERMGGDNFFFYHNTNLNFKENWYARVFANWVPGDHLNFHQDFSATAADNMSFYNIEGNIGLQATDVGTDGLHGILSQQVAAINTMLVKNNIMMCNIYSSVYTVSGTTTIEKNTLLFPRGATQLWLNYFETSPAATAVRSRNLVTCANFFTAEQNGMGTGGGRIDVGDNQAAANYSGYNTYWANGLAKFIINNAAGLMMSDLIPIVGSQAHWGHPSYFGAAERIKAVAVDGVHPGNSPNTKLAAAWRTVWNANGGITS